jgi:hypothetical protein
MMQRVFADILGSLEEVVLDEDGALACYTLRGTRARKAMRARRLRSHHPKFVAPYASAPGASVGR